MSIETTGIGKRKHRMQSEDPSLVGLRDRALIRAMVSSPKMRFRRLGCPIHGT